MKPPKIRITQLGRLVERLAEQLNAKFGPAGLVNLDDPDPYGFELEGRSMKRWVKEIWPGLPPLGGPVLSQAAVKQLCDSRRQDISSLQERLDSAGREIQSAGRRLDEERSQPQTQLQEARVFLSRIERNIGGLRSRKKQLLGAASRQEKEIRELNSWLGGLKPKGMKGFRDSTGRPVSPGEIKANTAKLESLQEAVKLNRNEARKLNQEIATAQETRSQALEQIKTLNEARQRAEAALVMQAADLKKEKQKLEIKRRDLDGLNKALSRSQALCKLHDEVLSQASELLLPMLMEPEYQAGEVPADAMQQCLLRAEAARERADRLGALLHLQTARLEPLITGMSQVSSQVRSVNNEIQKMEKELPGLLMPLMQPGGEPGGKYAKAAARISTLLARLNELSPKALEAHGELNQLKSILQISTKRAKAWQEAWREAVKREREQISQAGALVEEVRIAAAARKSQAGDLADQLEPLMRALAPIRAVELAPSLSALVGRVARMRFEALELRILSHQMADRLPEPLAPAQAKSPVTLKPYTSALRRLGGRQVDLERLYALGAASQRWHDIAAGPLVDEIRRPAEQVALKLSEELGKVSSQRDRIDSLRQRREQQLVRLGKTLQDERRFSSDTMSSLGQAQLLLSQQTQMLNRYRHGVKRAREEHLTLKNLLQQEQTTSKRLHEQLGSTQEELTQELQQTSQGYEDKLDRTTQHYERRLSETSEQYETRLSDTTRDYEEKLSQTTESYEQRLSDTTDTYQRQLSDTTSTYEKQLSDTTDTYRRRLSDTTNHYEKQLKDTTQGYELKLSDTTEHYETRLDTTTRHYQKQLSDTTSYYEQRIQKSTAEFTSQIEEITTRADELAGHLEHSQKLAKALKIKSLERHRLYRKSRHAIEWMDYWKERALEHEALLDQTRKELEQARKEYNQARTSLAMVSKERDSLEAQLAEERAARARQALDLLGGKALSVELAASQSEAGRWAALAQQLALALAAGGKEHEAQSGELRRQVDLLSSEAALLRKKLAAVSQVVKVAHDSVPNSVRPATISVRVTSLEPEHVASALNRLGKARGRLQKLGRSTLGHMAVIAALTGGLVLVPPGTPSKATRTESPLTAKVASINQLTNGFNETPLYDLPVSAGRVSTPLAHGSLELNLLPLRKDKRELPKSSVRGIKRLAKKAGIPHEVIITAARAIYSGQDLIESSTLRNLAERAKRIALSHPRILGELGDKLSAYDKPLKQASNKPRHFDEARFEERMYREYRNLGFSPAESLGALTSNRIAFEKMHKYSLPKAYVGMAEPILAMEKMDLKSFMQKASPYMKQKLKLFINQRGIKFVGDVDKYINGLAFDMYCAAKQFRIPVTLLMSIAHQETWYANVLGDQNMSASPFQIYRPTRALIRQSMNDLGFTAPPKGIQLQHHLTMATYMAAFHLRELMYNAQIYQKKKKVVNLNRVLHRYNGSVRYIAQVDQRRQELAKYLSS